MYRVQRGKDLARSAFEGSIAVIDKTFLPRQSFEVHADGKRFLIDPVPLFFISGRFKGKTLLVDGLRLKAVEDREICGCDLPRHYIYDTGCIKRSKIK